MSELKVFKSNCDFNGDSYPDRVVGQSMKVPVLEQVGAYLVVQHPQGKIVTIKTPEGYKMNSEGPHLLEVLVDVVEYGTRNGAFRRTDPQLANQKFEIIIPADHKGSSDRVVTATLQATAEDDYYLEGKNMRNASYVALLDSARPPLISVKYFDFKRDGNGHLIKERGSLVMDRRNFSTQVKKGNGGEV